jgi:hypothetical protein
MVTLYDAIIKAFIALEGTRNIHEINSWIEKNYVEHSWVDIDTTMTDMVPVSHNGNTSSNVPENKRVLTRESHGYYRLIK